MSLYTYNKMKVIWYRNNDSNDAVDIGNVVSIKTNRTLNPSNNKASIELDDNDLLYSNGVFLPQEGDKIFIYAKEITKANDTTLSNNDIIWNGKFVDYSRNESPDGVKLTLQVLDWGYDVFNVFSQRKFIDLGLTTNEVLELIIHIATENDDRTYNVDTSNIATTRNDGSLFPVIDYANTLKPVYELTDELSQPQWTNAEGEDVIKYPMVLDFRGTDVYWYEQPLSTSLVIDNYSDVISISYNTSNEQTATRLILEVGEDLDGDPVHTYISDNKNSSAVVKESFKSEIKLTGKNNDYDNEYNELRATAIANSWSNQKFRDEARTLAESFAETWFRTVGRKLPTIIVTLPRIDINLGELLSITRKRTPNGLYRAITISDNITSKSWTSTITTEYFEI